MMKITLLELTQDELAKIAGTAGSDKRRVNYETYIDQLLAHIAWLTQADVEVTHGVQSSAKTIIE